MAAVTDNSPPPGPDERPAQPEPGDEPPRLDPEQWRQFQEFQRFQEYLRFTQGEGAGQTGNGSGQPGSELTEWRASQRPVPAQPRDAVPYAGSPEAPTPPTGQPQLHNQLAGMQQQLAQLTEAQQAAERRANPPLWRKVLRNKWLHRLVVLAILLTLGPWIVSSLIGSDDKAQEDAKTARPGTRVEKNTREKTPQDAVTFVYDEAAYLMDYPDPRAAAAKPCGRAFYPQGAAEFARVLGQPTCEQALISMAKQVTDPDRYELPSIPGVYGQLREVRLGACQITVAGGPPMGEFDLKKDERGNWAISGFRKDERKCSRPSGSQSHTGSQSPSVSVPGLGPN